MLRSEESFIPPAFPSDRNTQRTRAPISRRFYLISSPFSCRDFSLGSGGTLPTQALMRWPPTDKVQDPQSPLESSPKKYKVWVSKSLSINTNSNEDMAYFLQEYFGFTPRPEAAALRELPALKFLFFPLYVRTVICSDDPLTPLFLEDEEDWNAIVLHTTAKKVSKRARNFMVILSSCLFYLLSVVKYTLSLEKIWLHLIHWLWRWSNKGAIAVSRASGRMKSSATGVSNQTNSSKNLSPKKMMIEKQREKWRA